ncbi:MAG: universal stress protein [Planctomycetota bacterium]
MGLIVLATDFSEEARRAFDPCVDLAKRLGHEVMLVSVFEEMPFEVVAGGGLAAVYPDRTELRADQEKQLQAIASDLASRSGVPVRAELLEGSEVARTIAEFAVKRDAAFVAIATHGRSGIKRLLLGSVAEALLRHAQTPVLVFPPRPE